MLRARDITPEGAGHFPGAVGLKCRNDIDIGREGQTGHRHMQLQVRHAQHRCGQGGHPGGSEHHGIEAFFHCQGERARIPLLDTGHVQDGEREDPRSAGDRRTIQQAALVGDRGQRRHAGRGSRRHLLGPQGGPAAGDEGRDGGGQEGIAHGITFGGDGRRVCGSDREIGVGKRLDGFAAFHGLLGRLEPVANAQGRIVGGHDRGRGDDFAQDQAVRDVRARHGLVVTGGLHQVG